MSDQPAQPDAAELLADRMAAIARSAHESNVARVDHLDSLISSELDPARRSEAADVAHKLAGSAGTFGYIRVSELARDLELKLAAEGDRAPEDPQQLLGVVGELRRLLAEEPDEID